MSLNYFILSHVIRLGPKLFARSNYCRKKQYPSNFLHKFWRTLSRV